MEAVNHYSETDLGNVSPNPRGEYDPKESYEYLDLVSYQGGSYLCLAEFETTITGTAPDPGHNTDIWQMLTLPGNLRPDYIAMHDDVVNKAAQVEISRAAVEQAQQEVEASQSDVQQLHEDTVQAAQEAENSRDSAAGYAQSAEASRKAAAESEQNINAQMTGLDEKVSESVTQAQEEIATARQQAINTIATQEDASVAEVKRVGTAALDSAGQALQEIRTTGQQAVQAVTDQKNTSVQAVKDETEDYIENKKKEIDDKTDEVTQAVNQAGEKQLQNIANSLDSTFTESGKAANAKAVGDALNTKITKFYASNQGETHIVDSDNGKIQDLVIYGKSEQATTNGYQLFDSAQIGNKTLGGLTSQINEDGSITVTGTSEKQVRFAYKMLLKAGTYTAKRITSGSKTSGSDLSSYIRYSNDDNKVIFPNNTFILDKDREVTIGVYCYDATKDIDQTIWFMLEKGSEAHDYEPYTGGVPSPNPDYPQEIKNVVDPEIKICGKNLLSPSYFFLASNHTGLNITRVEDKIKKVGTATEGVWQTLAERIPLKKGVYTISITCTDTKALERAMIIQKDAEGKTKKAEAFGIQGSENEKLSYTFTVLDELSYITVNQGISANISIDALYTIQIEKGNTSTEYEPYKEQAVTLPYTLNAIPVDSGGNVTIDSQQYIADYVDVERGKLVQRIWKSEFDGSDDENWSVNIEQMCFNIIIPELDNYNYKQICSYCNRYQYNENVYIDANRENGFARRNKALFFRDNNITDLSSVNLRAYLAEHPLIVMTTLEKPIEIDLTSEEIAAFKALATYYPTTNISVNSEQLDGYTVFNYPISMKNGWDYVKKQLNDNRDYIYDMDTQSAEAYVNSEYAVALTELEV